MYLLILLLPLLSSIYLFVFGRKVNYIIPIILLFIRNILIWIAFYEVIITESPVIINLFTWLRLDSFYVNFEFLFDFLSVSLLWAVINVSFIVHIYSINYMKDDRHINRFFALISLFTFFMIVFTSANNFFIMFLGFEGIGIASYLLINYWYLSIESNKAGMKSLTMNRLGDLAFTVIILVVIFAFGTTDFYLIDNISFYSNNTILFILSVFCLLAAIGKRANFPIHSWLPYSMVAPTPVSALIHAATLVTSGIFLLLRCSNYLHFSVLNIITIIGIITALIAGFIARVSFDIKRIIAYSTMSQCGFMMISLGLSQFNVTLFHLVNHAFFKALLFLRAGNIIHSIMNKQDFRNYGSLILFYPITYLGFLSASFALIAFPFLRGFYSKDFIIELSYTSFYNIGFIAYCSNIIIAFFTSFYTFRLILNVFYNKPSSKVNNTHEDILPIFILMIFAIFFGYFFNDIFVGIGSNNFNLLNYAYNVEAHSLKELNYFSFILPLIVTILAFFWSFITYSYNILPISIYTFLVKQFTFDLFLNKMNYIGLTFSKFISKVFDRGLLELLGPYSISLILNTMSPKVKRFDNENIISQSILIIFSVRLIILLSIVLLIS